MSGRWYLVVFSFLVLELCFLCCWMLRISRVVGGIRWGFSSRIELVSSLLLLLSVAHLRR
jgi:hypothetical protein